MLPTECQFVGLPLAQGGRAEAEALSDFSLPESAERTVELISDTPGYYKQNKGEMFTENGAVFKTAQNTFNMKWRNFPVALGL